MHRKVKNIHFIGIGGIGMSGIAEVLFNMGYCISGSDINETEITRRLVSLGAEVFNGHDPSNLGDADVVITSTAVKESNPEVTVAHKRNIPGYSARRDVSGTSENEILHSGVGKSWKDYHHLHGCYDTFPWRS
jgi:UDP-N-acetylmuramate--L-alanine ligase (EC 6.3.2.8)